MKYQRNGIDTRSYVIFVCLGEIARITNSKKARQVFLNYGRGYSLWWSIKGVK